MSHPAVPSRRLVPLEDRAPGWPKLDPGCTDTQYAVARRTAADGAVSDVVVAMITDCRGEAVGWDTCGRCVQHIIRCECADGVAPERGVVLIYRARNHVAYPVGMRGGYIGFRRDDTGQPAPMVLDSPIARMDAAAALDPQDQVSEDPVAAGAEAAVPAASLAPAAA